MTLSHALTLAAILTLTGCATVPSPPATETRPARAGVARPVAADRLAESYYHFSVAQMHSRAGRMPEAIAEVRLAIQRDPSGSRAPISPPRPSRPRRRRSSSSPRTRRPT